MSEGTRRVFLSKSGVGAAAVGLVALTPAAVASAGSSGSTAAAELDTGSLRGSLVAVVDDLRADSISLMVGEEEIVVQDRELVARLARAARR